MNASDCTPAKGESASGVFAGSQDSYGSRWCLLFRGGFSKYSNAGFLLVLLRRQRRQELPLTPDVDELIGAIVESSRSCVRRAGWTNVQNWGDGRRAGGIVDCGAPASERQGPERPEGAREDRPVACPACSERPEGANPRGSWNDAERGPSPAAQRPKGASSPPSAASVYTPESRRACRRPTPFTGTCLLRQLTGSAALLTGGRSRETVKSGVSR